MSALFLFSAHMGDSLMSSNYLLHGLYTLLSLLCILNHTNLTLSIENQNLHSPKSFSVRKARKTTKNTKSKPYLLNAITVGRNGMNGMLNGRDMAPKTTRGNPKTTSTMQLNCLTSLNLKGNPTISLPLSSYHQSLLPSVSLTTKRTLSLAFAKMFPLFAGMYCLLYCWRIAGFLLPS